jgi:Glycosyl hydrolases family 28
MLRMIKNYFLIILLCLFNACNSHQPVFSILVFGARGDGKTINTDAINRTIQACFDQGGGTVIIPAGHFLSGTIQLLSHIELHLDAGAILDGSRDTGDYRLLKSTLFNEGYTRYGLIYASNAEAISITGKGEINGEGSFFMHGINKPHVGHDFDRKYTRQGDAFMNKDSIFEDGPLSYDYRPGLLITLDHCQHINITDISLKDSPEWTLRIGDCDGVSIHGITIDNNRLIPNNDGIHCTTSRNILISDCNISVGDDAIIVSGFENKREASDGTGHFEFGNKQGIAENITVTNSILSSSSACIRVGYGDHPIRNLIFSNIVMYSSNRGIGVFSRSKSLIENVLFSNIVISTRLYSGHWWGKGEPIHISAVSDDSSGDAGKIRNIRFSNIIATAQTGIIIYGVKESLLENIVLDKIKLTIKPGKYSESYGGNFDLRPAFPLSISVFKHDIPGIYAQYVKGLCISGFNLDWAAGLPTFFTNGIQIENFDDISIEGMHCHSVFPAKSSVGIYLYNGSHAELDKNYGPDFSAISVIKQKVK